MKLSIIIVNYRTSGLAVECVRSLAADRWVRAHGRVIVVDNASGDDSLARLEAAAAEWGAGMRVIANARNGGFAAGNNVALREVLAEGPEAGELVLLLNPDTVVEAGAVGELVRFMEGRREVGIAGSRLMDEAGQVQCAAHRFPSPLGELEGMMRVGAVSRLLSRWRVSPEEFGETQACDWVSGAALMVRREVVEKIGLLDEGYFLYFEEVDWCRRAKAAGWEVWHVPLATVRHLEGAATGIKQGRRRRALYWYQSRRRYFRRAWGTLGWLAADCCWMVGWMGYQGKRMLGRGSGTDPTWFAWDLLAGDLRALLDGEGR